MSKPSGLKSELFNADTRDFSDEIAYSDHKTSFVVEKCRGRNVLDIGCVQHNPENYKSKYWLHKAIREVADSVVGLDLSEPGVTFLKERGFNVIVADACDFELGTKFDVIVAGDIVEHLGNIDGFLECAKEHLVDDGKILVSTPNPWYWKYIVKASLFARVQNNPEHTCWYCPVTFSQVAERHGLKMESYVYGSRYLRDRLLPIPNGLKNTSWHAVLVKD